MPPSGEAAGGARMIKSARTSSNAEASSSARGRVRLGSRRRHLATAASGTSPARPPPFFHPSLDTQSLEQQLISAQNSVEKDKLALARVIGLPLAQKFELADRAPYTAFDQPSVQDAIKQALATRKDRAASTKARSRKSW